MKKFCTILFLFVSAIAVAQTSPAITRWLQNTTVTARHYVSGNSTAINDASLVNVQSVKYSANYVYATTTGLPSYVTGPFLDGNPNFAGNQNAIFKFPLVPVQNTGTATATTGGNIGIFINGVALFDYRDGASYQLSSGTMKGGPYGGVGDGVWNRDAVVGEKGGFDCSKGHPAGTNYHHHQNPSAFKLDLNVISTICNLYNADGLYAIDSTQHSPLIGFAYDGFPIYGAYGYKNANGTGGIVRMKSSFTLRNITVRNTYSDGSSVTYGPNVIGTAYPLGYFKEDYQYNATSAATPDYLDYHNGRFCVTPEYPNGTYCYFATVDANWNSAYPYLVGPTFYGTRVVTKVNSILEATTTFPPSTAPYIFIAASAKSICSGTNVTFYAATYNGGLSPTYQWKKNGVNVGTNSKTYSSATLANNDIISCLLTNASSVTATSNNDTMSVTTTVTPSVSITSTATSICTGMSVTFTATATNGGTTPAYQWKKNGSNVGANASAYTDVALSNGDSITCVLTSNASCATSPTATSNAVKMSVTTTVTPTVAIVASATTVCTGTSVTFTATATNGGTTPSYQWKKNGSNVGTNASTYTDISLANGDSITCVLTSNASCVTTTTATSNFVKMTVNALPTVSFSGLASSYSLSAAAATLTGSPTGGTFTGTGISGSTFTPSVAGVGGPYTISYYYTNNNGCSNVTTQQTTVINCAVPSTPGTITTVGGTATICPGDTKSYSIAAVSGATSYTWTAPTGGTITAGQGSTLVTINYTSTFTASAALTVVANNACGSSAAKSLTITRNTAATPGTITGLTYNVCNGSGVTYSVANVAGRTYNWTFNTTNATVATGQGTNAITANFNSAYLTGIISVTASNACGTSAARSATIRAYPATPGTITGAATVCPNATGVPYSIAAVTGAVSYYWYGPTGSHISDGVTTSVGTGLTTTSIAVTVNYGATAGYLRVRANNACLAGSYRTLSVATACFQRSSKELVADFAMKVSPNPATSDLSVSFSADKNSNCIVLLRDLFGRTQLQLKEIAVKGENNYHLNVSKLTKGVYFLEMLIGDKKTITKVVVE